MNIEVLKNHIAEDRLSAVLKAIHTISDSINFLAIEPLSGGYSSSQSYKLNLNHHLYVLRVMGLDQALEDREQQTICLQLAGDADIAPACFYANATDGVIIMKYIEPNQIEGSFDFLGCLANKLYDLHSLEFPPPHQTIFDYTEELEKSFNNIELSPSIQTFFNHIHDIKLILAPHLIKTACHNDLNPNNFIFNSETIYLIDWEAAGEEDPFFDLATACNFFTFDQDAENYFLINYFGAEITDFQHAKLYFMKQISYYFYALHFLQFAHQEGISLKEELPNTPSYLEWAQGYSNQEYGLSTGQDFVLLANVYVQNSLKQIEAEYFALAMKLLHTKLI